MREVNRSDCRDGESGDAQVVAQVEQRECGEQLDRSARNFSSSSCLRTFGSILLMSTRFTSLASSASCIQCVSIGNSSPGTLRRVPGYAISTGSPSAPPRPLRVPLPVFLLLRLGGSY